MDNINKDNINTNAYKNIIRNFNIVIGISSILLISVIYITFICSINIQELNSNIDLASLEIILSEKFIYYIKIFISFLIPLTFFIFIFLFVLNPIHLKSLLISFILLFIIALYLYKLPYDIIINPFKDINCFIKLIVQVISANLLMLFISAMSYIKYDLKKLNCISDFYTMIAEMIIWTFLIFFIISLIILSVFALLYFNEKIDIKKLIRFLIRDDMKNIKIILSVFVLLKVGIVYFSYVIYNKMINTKLSISVSRVLALFISAASVSAIFFTVKYNLLIHNYGKFLLFGFFIFSVFFILNMFFFRIDKGYKKTNCIIYLISNAVGGVFSVFSLVLYINRFHNMFLIIFNIIIFINFIYNMFFSIFIKNKSLISLYNYLYIVFFIIILFH